MIVATSFCQQIGEGNLFPNAITESYQTHKGSVSQSKSATKKCVLDGLETLEIHRMFIGCLQE